MKCVIGRGPVSLQQKSLGTGPLLQSSALQGASESEDRPTRGFQPAGFPRLIAPTAIGVPGAEQELPKKSQINSFSRHSGSAHTSRQPSSLRGRKEHVAGPITKFARGACQTAVCNVRAVRRRGLNAPAVATSQARLATSRTSNAGARSPATDFVLAPSTKPLSRHLARGSRIRSVSRRNRPDG